MSHADDVFYRQFGAVLILLVIFAFLASILAHIFGGAALERISQSEDAVLERIKPIGSVVTEAMAAAPAAAAAVPAPQPAPTATAKPAAPAQAAPKPAEPKQEVAAAAPAPAATAAAALDDGGAEGKKTYNTACMACHMAGVANAPKFGDKAAWAPRAKQGLAALYNSGLKGKGALMPAKGGNASLSDDAVKAAIRYMLSEAGVTAK